MIFPNHSRHVFEESTCKSRDAICQLCGNKVSFESNAYYFGECGSNFHKECLAITNPKSHEHTLTFIRREISGPCDVCGREEKILNTYGCLQCDFIVHRNCIYLPKFIKITRHSHRLSHILRFSDGGSVCGVCRNRVNVRYGGFSCIEKSCNYVVDIFCIMYLNVWDGKDVEGEPEEKIDSQVDLKSLVEINGRSARHFCHEHDLMRVGVDGEESGHVCQACILPIEFGIFLDCKQCEFSLHEACGNLPRKLENASHIHPLTMHVDTMSIEDGFFTCSVCYQHSCGFMYKCSQKDCGFKIDVKCAYSFVEPFKHSAHPHLLALRGRDFNLSIPWCSGCNIIPSRIAAYCRICCWFTLEFKCRNLPELVKYKCDTHPLTLSCGQGYSYQVVEPLEWCEICEENINKNIFIYTCHGCCTTLHVDCILGKYPYLKSGNKIKVSGFEVEIASNGVSRPSCRTCHRMCQDKLVFISGKDESFCSIDCVHFSTILVKNIIAK